MGKRAGQTVAGNGYYGRIAGAWARIKTLLDDVEWAPITVSPGFKIWGAAPAVCTIGGITVFKGGFETISGNFATNTTVLVGTVPVGFRPSYWQEAVAGLPVSGNSGLVASGSVQSNGGLEIRVPSGTSANTVSLKPLGGYQAKQ